MMQEALTIPELSSLVVARAQAGKECPFDSIHEMNNYANFTCNLLAVCRWKVNALLRMHPPDSAEAWALHHQHALEDIDASLEQERAHIQFYTPMNPVRFFEHNLRRCDRIGSHLIQASADERYRTWDDARFVFEAPIQLTTPRLQSLKEWCQYGESLCHGRDAESTENFPARLVTRSWNVSMILANLMDALPDFRREALTLRSRASLWDQVSLYIAEMQGKYALLFKQDAPLPPVTPQEFEQFFRSSSYGLSSVSHTLLPLSPMTEYILTHHRFTLLQEEEL